MFIRLLKRYFPACLYLYSVYKSVYCSVSCFAAFKNKLTVNKQLKEYLQRFLRASQTSSQFHGAICNGLATSQFPENFCRCLLVKRTRKPQDAGKAAKKLEM